MGISMLKKFTHALMALTLALGFAMSSANDAEARRGGGVALGVAAGIIGLGLLGAAARSDGYYADYDDGGYCHRGPRECHWSGRRCFENEYGDTVCRGGRYLCERQVVCD